MGQKNNISVMLMLGELTNKYLLSKYDVMDSEKYLISCFYRYICDKGFVNKGSLYEYACSMNNDLDEFYGKLKSLLDDNDFSYDSIKSYFAPEDVYKINNDFIIKILGINGGVDSVFYHYGTGVGNFLIAVANENRWLDLYGNDDNRENALVAAMALSIVKREDCSKKILFADEVNSQDIPRYNYAFSNLYEPYKRVTEGMALRTWKTIEKIVNSANKEKFRCAFIVGKEILDLYSSETHEVFSNLVLNGYFEGVVEYLSPKEKSQSYLLVFSNGYESNGKVKVAGKETWEACGYSESGFLDRYANNMDVLNFERDIFSGFNYIDPDDLSEDIPDDGYRTIGSIFDIIQGTQYTVGRFPKDERGDSGYCIITPPDLDRLNWSDLRKVELSNIRVEETVVHKGDVLLTSRYGEYRCVYIDEEPPCNTVPSGGIVILRLKKEMVNEFEPLYLNMFLISKTGNNEIKKIEKGDMFHYISIRDLKKIRLPDISISEQNMKCVDYSELLKLKKLFYGKYREIEKQLEEYRNIEL